MDIRRAVIAAGGSAAVAALTFGAIPVGAQALSPISVTPTSGPAGTVATVSGTDCIGSNGPGDLLAYMWSPTSGPDDEPDFFFGGTVAADGSWTAAVQFEATDPVGTYTISATCFDSPAEDAPVVVEYDFVDFELTAAAPAPEAPADPAVEPAAAPAPAVSARPSFVG
jgi:hypothetical protein